MGKYSGWLIASDFDGTLVPDDTKRIAPDVKAALLRFTAGGGLFTVCTGRTKLGFHAFDPDIINAPALLANGGMAYDYAAQRVVFCDGIGEESFAAIRDVRDLFPELSIELYALDDTCAINTHGKAHRHFTSQDIPYRVITDPSEATLPWAKVMFGGDEADVLRVQKYLAASHPEISFLPTRGGYLEVLAPGVDKGSALLKLGRLAGADPAKLCAVGDGYNDEAMLRAAPHSFVPVNGDERMKAIAEYVVRTNNDGAVANVVEIIEGLCGK